MAGALPAARRPRRCSTSAETVRCHTRTAISSDSEACAVPMPIAATATSTAPTAIRIRSPVRCAGAMSGASFANSPTQGVMFAKANPAAALRPAGRGISRLVARRARRDVEAQSRRQGDRLNVQGESLDGLHPVPQRRPYLPDEQLGGCFRHGRLDEHTPRDAPVPSTRRSGCLL